jgi:hypothetical protein
VVYFAQFWCSGGARTATGIGTHHRISQFIATQDGSSSLADRLVSHRCLRRKYNSYSARSASIGLMRDARRAGM